MIWLKSKKRLVKITKVILAILLVWPNFAFAAEPSNPSGLPDIVASQSVDSSNNTVGTEVTSPAGQKFYGGIGGNEAILNYEPGYLHGFVQYNIGNCKDKIGLPAMLCFVLEYPGMQPTSIQTLWSRTYRDGVADLEISILLYPDNLIVGDVYGFNTPGFEYSYFGKNLRLTPDNSYSNSFWNLPGYKFNPQAQAYWDSSSADKNKVMNQTIERLKSNTKPLRNNIFDAYVTWKKKPFDGICGDFSASCSEINQYPEGRVWYTPGYPTSVYSWGMLVINPAVTYRRKATMIVDQGNAQISTQLSPYDDASSLGIVVRNGDVYIQNTGSKKMTIKANIFVPNGKIRLWGSNIELIGSFVAKDFEIANPSTSTNISFIYDSRGESAYPPGFRDLQIPSLLAK